MTYGFPYMGSKSSIAALIGRLLPRADNFYDIFGGGGAITHYMATARRGHFKTFVYNEMDPLPFQLFKDAASGKYAPENFTPGWVSKQEFDSKKNHDPYIKYLWSFGNNGKDYLFGDKIVEIKRIGHQAVVFGEISPDFTRITGISEWPGALKTTTARRLFLRKRVHQLRKKNARNFELEHLEHLERLERLQQLEQLQRLERLQRLQRIDNLEFKCGSYHSVEIRENSVVYCDPPYANTAGYNGRGFDSAAFLDWASKSRHPVFVSEYADLSGSLRLFAEIPKRNRLAAGGGKAGVERLFMNNAAHRYIKDRAPADQKAEING